LDDNILPFRGLTNADAINGLHLVNNPEMDDIVKNERSVVYITSVFASRMDDTLANLCILFYFAAKSSAPVCCDVC
jgi:hypothetical protein